MFSRSCDLDLDPTRASERASKRSEAPWARGISRSSAKSESIRSVGRISGNRPDARDEGPAKIKASFNNNGTIPDVLDRFNTYPQDGQVLFFLQRSCENCADYPNNFSTNLSLASSSVLPLLLLLFDRFSRLFLSSSSVKLSLRNASVFLFLIKLGESCFRGLILVWSGKAWRNGLLKIGVDCFLARRVNRKKVREARRFGDTLFSKPEQRSNRSDAAKILLLFADDG